MFFGSVNIKTKNYNETTSLYAQFDHTKKKLSILRLLNIRWSLWSLSIWYAQVIHPH